MKLNKSQREVLNKQFQASFNDEALEKAFKEEYNEVYRKWGSELLAQQGFPKYVDVNDGDFVKVKITPKSGTDVFVDYVEETDEIESAEEFEAVRNDSEFFIEIILKNINATNIELEPKGTREEFLEQYPTEAYLAKQMSNYFSPIDVETRLKETQEIQEEVKEAAREEGINAKRNFNTNDYKIENIRVKKSYEQLAESVLDEGYINSSNRVQNFLNRDFYNLLIRKKLIDYRIVITRDPEEFEEE
ncbi:hypothetical protein ACFYSI_13030 [Staphylococcus xylosus]|uniref:hypothetical protein n=1 Tax=Staphylococcus xylosus TaxID=1288 RepID=UPI0036B34D49